MSKVKPDEIKSEPPSQPSGDADASTSSAADNTISSTEDETAVPALARSAVESFISRRVIVEPPPAPESSILSQRLACFVSIKMHGGELRGCIGTVEPEQHSLASEIISNAIKSATRDPRFFPVTEAELPHLRYSVDVLEPPEPARFEDLDPSTYGVVVEDERGRRRGLLLPAIEGVETARQQVQIAARKAGIAAGEPLTLYRFRTLRFREPSRATSNSSPED
ncbi:MAG TPA: AmmeMemoRadiSam system protein A [Pyrinomonadaceae bacterium]|jgi:AmmeMemoRadiSam system protein A|nr:AmmeMemoRadiSam system protein A [Pyrinomonadaceae bacterium]